MDSDTLPPRYTYNDYVQWEGRWEIIEGVRFAVKPSPRHQYIVSALGAEMRNGIKQSGCDCNVYPTIDYKLSNHTIINPDILVVCEPITNIFLDFTPEVVAEILSESTESKDRQLKFALYEAEGIPYYIMIDADKDLVEVYQLVDGRYQRQPVDQSSPFTFQLTDCRFELVFDEIWE